MTAVNLDSFRLSLNLASANRHFTQYRLYVDKGDLPTWMKDEKLSIIEKNGMLEIRANPQGVRFAINSAETIVLSQASRFAPGNKFEAFPATPITDATTIKDEVMSIDLSAIHRRAYNRKKSRQDVTLDDLKYCVDRLNTYKGRHGLTLKVNDDGDLEAYVMQKL